MLVRGEPSHQSLTQLPVIEDANADATDIAAKEFNNATVNLAIVLPLIVYHFSRTTDMEMRKPAAHPPTRGTDNRDNVADLDVLIDKAVVTDLSYRTIVLLVVDVHFALIRSTVTRTVSPGWNGSFNH